MTVERRSSVGYLLLTVLTLAAVVIGVGDRAVSRWAYAVERGRIQANSEALSGASEVSNAFRAVAKIAKPGVVHIRVGGFGSSRMSTGSGFVFDGEGHILTNNHVVAGREEGEVVSVRFHDDEIVEAKVVGTDPKTDLAVLKVSTDRVHPLKFGDSDALEVGDWVLAVGAPFGLSQTVTHGIVSAKGRAQIPGIDLFYQDFIQTDAAINPGNSGGPLVNIKGEVVGINTAIATSGEEMANAGVAFTIPSNLARRVAESLKKGGKVTRGWLGVSLDELTRAQVELLGLKNDRGVLVDVVYEGSPAATGGLLAEDVILKVNGRKVASIRELQFQIAEVEPGAEARFDVVRDGEEKKLSIRVGEQPDDPRAMNARPIAGRAIDRLGLYARSYEPSLAVTLFRARLRELARDASHYVNASGVLVTGSAGEGSKVVAGVLPGELIVECNGKPVRSIVELNKAIEREGDRSITLKVLNPEGEDREVTVRNR